MAALECHLVSHLLCLEMGQDHIAYSNRNTEYMSHCRNQAIDHVESIGLEEAIVLAIQDLCMCSRTVFAEPDRRRSPYSRYQR